MNDTATWRAFQENMTGVKRFLVLEWFFTRWPKRNIVVIAREEGFPTNPWVMIIYWHLTNSICHSQKSFFCAIKNHGTVFENGPKSRIQHCERSELCLHFELRKVKTGRFWRFFENLKLEVKQCYQTGQFWWTKYEQGDQTNFEYLVTQCLKLAPKSRI